MYVHIGLAVALFAQISLSLPAIADTSAAIRDPTRPPFGKVTRQAPRRTNLDLQSTLVSAERRLAVINGKTLTIGQQISGATIREITPYHVVLTRSGKKFTLSLLPKGVIHHYEISSLRELPGQNNGAIAP